MPIKRSTDKKMNLLLYKEKILNDIKYYDKRINEDLLANASTSVNYVDSSDSEDECPFTINTGPMVNQLESQQNMLQTGFLATQELASLTVVQSQVDVMVDDPVLNGEAPVTQPGSWKEVNADCRIDLVPFSTTFYVHKANGLFGAKSYHSLKVLPVKPAQEAELSKSVLTRVRTPSDAVEVLRSYSVAYRSRRTTLAKLADKFAHNLHMEPMAGGGYMLKCANLLEISWVLENKWSPVAPFYHKMIFDLENMDECYIKIIRYAHKQLADPSTDTNMRTLILAKIITTCLEAQGASELHESMESDKESVKSIEKRRLTLDDEAPEPKKNRNGNKNDGKKDGNTRDDESNKDNTNHKDNIDDQIMAPPKSLPKKAKSKGKENTDQNRKPAKRAAVENETSTVKKTKTDNNVRHENEKVNAGEKGNQNKGKTNAKIKDKVTQSQINTEKSAKSAKVNLQMKTNAEEKSDQDQNDNTENLKNKEKVTRNQNEKDRVSVIQNEKGSQIVKESAKDSQKAKTVKSKNQEEKANIPKEKNDIQEENIDNAQRNRNVESQEKAKKKVVKVADSEKVADKIVASSKNDPNTKNPEPEKKSSKNKVVVSSKNDPKAKNSDNQKSPTDKAIATSKNTPKTKESGALEANNKDKKVVSPKNNVVTENKAKNGTDYARLIEIDDIPIMSVNYNNDNVPNHNNNIKTTKNQKGYSKSTNANKNGPKKDAKHNKHANIEPTNVNKKTTKDSNAQNIKKSIVNKDTESNTKPSADNAVPKNDKHPQKNNANKAEHNQKTSKINDENSKNQHKTRRDPQKTVTQNLKPPKQNDSEKKTVTKEIVTNDPKNKENLTEKNTEKKRETTENKQSEVVTEKMAKISNVATTKEHTANIVDIKKPTKIGDGKSKMVIKTLTHKNAGKKAGEKFNISRKIKNVNAGNIAVNFKTGKETDSGSKTKIPMKLSVHESLKKKNPLRISPRKLPSSFRSSSAISVKQKNHFTNIPRLLKKPDPKKISK